MRPEGPLRYISVQEFSETTGVSLPEVKALYAVTVGGRLQVPLFMLDAAQASVSSGGSDLQEELDTAASVPAAGETTNNSQSAIEGVTALAADCQDTGSISPEDQAGSFQDKVDSDRLGAEQVDPDLLLTEESDSSDSVKRLEEGADFDSSDTLDSVETTNASETYEADEALASVDTLGDAETVEGLETHDDSETYKGLEIHDDSETMDGLEIHDNPETIDGLETHDDSETIDGLETHDESEALNALDVPDDPEPHNDLDSCDNSDILDSLSTKVNSEALDDAESLYYPENYVSSESFDDYDSSGDSETPDDSEIFPSATSVSSADDSETIDSGINPESSQIENDSESLLGDVVSDGAESFEHSRVADFEDVDNTDSSDSSQHVDDTDNSGSSSSSSSSHHVDDTDSSLHADSTDSSEHSNDTNSSEKLEPELDPFERLKNRIRLSHSQMQAGAFARFFARIFDLALFISPPAYAYLMYGNSLIDTNTLQQQLIAVVALVSICIVLALFLDAVCYALAGNTPGKALLTLRVSDSSGNPLSFKDYLFRNFSVLARGLAFLIFPFTLLALFMQFRRVNQGRPTSYDLKRGIIVEDDSSGITGKFFFVVVFSMLLLIAIGGYSKLISSIF